MNNAPKVPSRSEQRAEIKANIKKLRFLLAEVSAVARQLLQEMPEVAPAAPIAKELYGFLLPDRIGPGFNDVSTVKARALPSDVFNVRNVAHLEDFNRVLLALADPATRASNRNAIFIDDSRQGAFANAASKIANDVASGKSEVGFNVTVLKASPGGQGFVCEDGFAWLYVVEDRLRDRMIIAGTEAISQKMTEKLEQAGITYLYKGDPSAAMQINEFLARGAKWRGENKLLYLGETQSVVENIIYGLEKYLGGPDAARDLGTGNGSATAPVCRGETVGNVIQRASDPALSIQITKAGPRLL